MPQCVEVVECSKGQCYQTFTTYQLQYVEQLYNNFQRSVQFSLRCLSTDVSPMIFKGVNVLSRYGKTSAGRGEGSFGRHFERSFQR